MLFMEINSASFLLEEAEGTELSKQQQGAGKESQPDCWNCGKTGKKHRKELGHCLSPPETQPKRKGRNSSKKGRMSLRRKRSDEKAKEVCPCGILQSDHLLEEEFLVFLPLKLYLRVSTTCMTLQTLSRRPRPPLHHTPSAAHTSSPCPGKELPGSCSHPPAAAPARARRGDQASRAITQSITKHLWNSKATYQNVSLFCWNTLGLAKNILVTISCRNQKLFIKTNYLGEKNQNLATHY